jgi:hypothetical protein
VWDKLVAHPETPSLTITIRSSETGKLETHTIENPVVVLTLSTSASVSPDTPPLDIWDQYRPYPNPNGSGEWVFKPYYANGDDGLINNWVTTHKVDSVSEGGVVTYAPGTALGYLDRHGYDRTCFNPSSPDAVAGSVDAVTVGVTSVGMPWTFGTTPEQAWSGGPADAVWWGQQVVVLVADRDAFVRPSFNPSVRVSTSDLYTDNGIPMWKAADETYRFPVEGEALFDAYQDATAGFRGFIPPTTYLGTTGFQNWLTQWKLNSWTVPSSWETLFTAAGFPFSGMGLTLNWPDFAAESPGDLSTDFAALSEFIHATEKPMFLITVLEPYQYYGAPLPDQVPWCGTCEGDFNRDGLVTSTDLLEMLQYWDAAPSNASLQYKLDRSSPTVGIADLLHLLGAWGPCTWPLQDWMPEDCQQNL